MHDSQLVNVSVNTITGATD